jgi:hypothetical protein
MACQTLREEFRLASNSGTPLALPASSPLAAILPIRDLPNLLDISKLKLKYSTLLRYKTRHGKDSTKVIYLEHANGAPYTIVQKRAFRTFMRQVFILLGKYGLAPRTWGLLNLESWEHIRMNVYFRFPGMWACEDEWKLKFWCQCHYPGWHKKYLMRKNGAASAAKVEAEEDEEDKAEDAEVDEVDPQSDNTSSASDDSTSGWAGTDANNDIDMLSGK